MICWHRQNVSCLQIVSVHHPGDITAMFAPDLHFLTRTPFLWVKNAEALQKIWNLEKFWGFGTRTAPAGGGQYLTGGGGHRGGRRCRAVGLWLIRQGGGSAQGVPRDGSRAARRRRKGGRGIDKASDCLLSLSPKPKALSR